MECIIRNCRKKVVMSVGNNLTEGKLELCEEHYDRFNTNWCLRELHAKEQGRKERDVEIVNKLNIY